MIQGCTNQIKAPEFTPSLREGKRDSAGAGGDPSASHWDGPLNPKVTAKFPIILLNFVCSTPFFLKGENVRSISQLMEGWADECKDDL